MPRLIRNLISGKVLIGMPECGGGLYATKSARPLICCRRRRLCCLFSRSTRFASSLVVYNLGLPPAFLGRRCPAGLYSYLVGDDGQQYLNRASRTIYDGDYETPAIYVRVNGKCYNRQYVQVDQCAQAPLQLLGESIKDDTGIEFKSSFYGKFKGCLVGTAHRDISLNT